MSEIQHIRSSPSWPRIVTGLAMIVVFFTTSLVLWRTGMLDLLEGDTLEQAVIQIGPLGPILVIGRLTDLPSHWWTPLIRS